jgi:hypothetical protein
MNKDKQEYKPTLIALAEFANKSRFQIDQVNAKGGCRITDLNTKKYSYSGSIPNAWKSVMYQAGVVHRTENTSGWKG